MTLITSNNQPSIVDILSDAFATLNRAPWILLIPLLLNAYLWFVPGVSLAPVIEQTAQLMRELPSDATADMMDIRDQSLGLLAQLGQDDMRPQLAWLNIVPYSVYTFRAAGASAEALGLPFVVALPASVAPDQTEAFMLDVPVTQVRDGIDFIVIWGLINVFSLVFSGLFLEMVRDSFIPVTTALPLRAVRTAGRLLLYALLIVAVITILLIPLSIFTFLLLSVNPAFGAFLIFLGSGVWLWAGVYLGFTREVMVISQVNPVEAIKTSFRIVRHSFWRTLSLLFVLLFIISGLGIVFSQLMTSTAGRIGTVIISAYLMSGFVLARMRFVKEHIQAIAESPRQG